jgi:hypothetical protein
MKTHHFASPEISLDFDAALKRASAVADELLGENILLSWYDRERDLESPAHASECHEGCPTKVFWDYALNRGGRWRWISTMGALCFISCHWGSTLRVDETQTQRASGVPLAG